MTKFYSYALGIHGAYWLATGLVGLADATLLLGGTNTYGDPFFARMYAASLGLMGMACLWTALKAGPDTRCKAGWVATLVGMGVGLVELFSLPRLGYPLVLWIDLVERILLGVVLMRCLVLNRKW